MRILRFPPRGSVCAEVGLGPGAEHGVTLDVVAVGEEQQVLLEAARIHSVGDSVQLTRLFASGLMFSV